MSPRLAYDRPTVAIVEHREARADGLVRAVVDLGFPAVAWTAMDDCLADLSPEVRGCLLVNHASVELPAEALLSRLENRRVVVPVVYLWSRCDVATVVRAMRAGALGGLKWPGPPSRLAQALREAIAFDAAHHAARRDEVQCRRRVAHLDDDERRLLAMLAAGLANKDIAFELNVCLRTAEDRRAKLMEKMKVDSLAELIRQSIVGKRPASRPHDWGIPHVPTAEPVEPRHLHSQRIM